MIYQFKTKISDVFPEVIPVLPLKRELDFTIELVAVVVPNSKDPYQMNILELNELKLQLQGLIDRNYIRPSVSPWGVPILFVVLICLVLGYPSGKEPLIRYSSMY